jgi:site-specific recombinase XerD
MNIDLTALTDNFLKDEQLKNRRNQGFKTMKRGLPKFTNYITDNEIHLPALNVKDALNYQKYLIETGRKDGNPYSSRTILSYLYSAGCFCSYLKKVHIIRANPFKEIRKVRQKKSLPKHILKEKEMDDFLSFVSRFYEAEGLLNQISRYRFHVLFELMYSTGLRICETAGLKVDDIDFARNAVIVREGKGGRERIAFLNDYAKEVLRIYIDRFRKLTFNEYNDKNGDLLFGISLSNMQRAVNIKLKEYAEVHKIKSFSSHGFRHAVGYHLLRAGCNIRHIQQILGHERLRSTEVYTKVDKEDLKNVIDTYHPRKWREKKL